MRLPPPSHDGHALTAGFSSAWQGVTAGVSRPHSICSVIRLSGCGMVCGFGGMCLRTVVLSTFLLTPTSQVNDMRRDLYRQVLVFWGFPPNNVTMDIEIRVMIPHWLGVYPVFSLLCFAGALPSLSCLHWDSVDLNVRIHMGPLFRERMLRGSVGGHSPNPHGRGIWRTQRLPGPPIRGKR